MIAMRGSIIGSHPRRPHSFTYHGSKVSFHRALMSRIDMEARDRIQPAKGSQRFMGANPKSPGAQGVKTSSRRRLSSLPELVRILPTQQLIYLWLAIFCTFSMIGFV